MDTEKLVIEKVVVENKEFKICNNTFYNIKTPDAVIKILEYARYMKVRGVNYRIRIFFGNDDTGLDWCEEHNIMGTINRSTGKIQVPLLMAKVFSYGGDAILTANIVKITIGKTILYKHPEYKLPKLHNVYGNVFKEDSICARFNTEQKAINYIKFLKGERNRL